MSTSKRPPPRGGGLDQGDLIDLTEPGDETGVRGGEDEVDESLQQRMSDLVEGNRQRKQHSAGASVVGEDTEDSDETTLDAPQEYLLEGQEKKLWRHMYGVISDAEDAVQRMRVPHLNIRTWRQRSSLQKENTKLDVFTQARRAMFCYKECFSVLANRQRISPEFYEVLGTLFDLSQRAKSAVNIKLDQIKRRHIEDGLEWPRGGLMGAKRVQTQMTELANHTETFMKCIMENKDGTRTTVGEKQAAEREQRQGRQDRQNQSTQEVGHAPRWPDRGQNTRPQPVNIQDPDRRRASRYEREDPGRRSRVSWGNEYVNIIPNDTPTAPPQQSRIFQQSRPNRRLQYGTPTATSSPFPRQATTESESEDEEDPYYDSRREPLGSRPRAARSACTAATNTQLSNARGSPPAVGTSLRGEPNFNTTVSQLIRRCLQEPEEGVYRDRNWEDEY